MVLLVDTGFDPLRFDIVWHWLACLNERRSRQEQPFSREYEHNSRQTQEPTRGHIWVDEQETRTALSLKSQMFLLLLLRFLFRLEVCVGVVVSHFPAV